MIYAYGPVDVHATEVAGPAVCLDHLLTQARNLTPTPRHQSSSTGGEELHHRGDEACPRATAGIIEKVRAVRPIGLDGADGVVMGDGHSDHGCTSCR